ncbi:MAG: RHS repeat-associated core domain-containing protein [bacterium]|nr:RHS repeat-associated core domain-containing protein [bacterium]
MSEQNTTRAKLNQPGVKEFQLDSSAVGDVTKSVNLYRGDVNLPLKLVGLPGPNGLDLNISAFYESNVTRDVDKWNLEAPTGVLGLGWSLPYDYISFEGNGTASWLEGDFYLHLGGNPHKLVRIEKTGTDRDTTLTFAAEAFPLWEIQFQPHGTKEKWQIKQDNGRVLIFGDITSQRNTVQSGVRWDNWAGSSQNDSAGPEQYGIAWNLSAITDQWGNTLTYEYLNDDLKLTPTMKYTRASYLKRVIDATGQSVEFYYQPKDKMEYSPLPHYINENEPYKVYQDRYETKYLQMLVVRSPRSGGRNPDGFNPLLSSPREIETIGNEENVYYKVEFQSGLLALDESGNGSMEPANTSKRYLESVIQKRGETTILPAMNFRYELKKNSVGRGRLISVQYPEGGEAHWNYKNIELPEAGIFSLQYTANRPAGNTYEGAVPGIWFGPDYIIVTWTTRSKMQVQAFSHGGYWTDAPFIKDIDVNIDDPDYIQVVPAQDFFTLYFHNRGNITDYLFLFQKKDYQFGKWSCNKYDVDLGTHTIAKEETALVCGKNFAALHVGGTKNLHRWRYNRQTGEWTGDVIAGVTGSDKMALAAQNDTLFASFYAGSGSRDQVFYLDEQYKWRKGPQSNIRPFQWNPAYVNTYWTTGEGFCAATYINDHRPATIIVTRWNREFSEFDDQTLHGDTGAQLTYSDGSTLVNGGKMFRFNGAAWDQGTFGMHPRKDRETAASDNIINARKSGSVFNPCWVFPYDPWNNSWQGNYKLDDEQLYSENGPVSRGNYLTVGNRLYTLDPETGKFETVEGLHPDAEPDVDTVTNKAPIYIAYQEKSDNPEKVTTYIAVLENGSIKGKPVPFEKAKFYADAKSGRLLAGPGAFVTYEPHVPFKDSKQFTLHRILNHQVKGVQTDCVVADVEVHSDDRVYKTEYTYDTAQAVFDPSGRVMQYPGVTAERKCGTGGESYGKTKYTYYNGLCDGLSDGGTEDAIRKYYSLTNGYIRTVTEYDDRGTVVASTTKQYNAVIPTQKKDGGFTLLSKCAKLTLTVIDNTVNNLPVISLGKKTGKVKDVVKRKTIEYDAVTAQPIRIIQNNHNSVGEEETRKVEHIYAWTIPGYGTMKNPPAEKARILNQVTQTTFFMEKKAKQGFEPVQSYIKTYKSAWGNHAESWGLHETYNWKNETGTPGQIPAFDYRKPDTGKWLKMTVLAGRSKAGLPARTTNGMEVQATTLYEKNGIHPVATFVNGATDQVGYTGFQEYETDTGWRRSSGEPIGESGDDYSGDSHTGERSVHIKKGSGIKKTFPAVPGARRYVFACWVKTPDGEVDAYWKITVGSNPPHKWSVPDSPAEWTYIFTTIELEDTAPADITFEAVNGSETQKVLIDDIHFSPVDCTFSAQVYDHVHFQQTAQMGGNGETSRIFYNKKLRPAAKTGPDDKVNTLEAVYFSRSGNNDRYNGKEPNSRLQIQARLGGSYDDFRDTNWEKRWTASNPAGWEVKNRALVHAATSADSITYNAGDDWSDYGVGIQVDYSSPVKQPLGMKIGSRINMQWNPGGNRWELLDNGAVVATSTAPIESSMTWLMVVRPASVIFYMNEKQILHHMTTRNAEKIRGRFELFAADSGISFSRVLIYKKPVIGMTYLGRTKQKLQEQQYIDKEVIVRQIFHDALGRKVIETKPAACTGSVLGYRPGFVQGFDPLKPGTMAGPIAKSYPGDNGYPYDRSRLEYSSTGRQLETGKPGEALAIRDGNENTERYIYGTNGKSEIFTHLTPGQYLVKVILTPSRNKNKTADTTIMDRIGNIVAHWIGEPGEQNKSLPDSYKLDSRDHPEETKTPNYYAPPTGEPGDWQTGEEFNTLNLQVQTGSSDTGTQKCVHDDLGRIRFIRQSGDTPRFIYNKYDNLDRITEKGYYKGDWNPEKLKENANRDWPKKNDGSAVWRHRYEYDGVNEEPRPNAIGRISRITTNSETEKEVIEERFHYDGRGNTVTRTLQTGKGSPVSITYGSDMFGNVLSIQYPAFGELGPREVVYDYDMRGLIAGIGTPDSPGGYACYKYDAMGNPTQEKLAGNTANPIARTFAYSSPGRLKTIDDPFLREKIYYEKKNATGTNTPVYNGGISAIDYKSKREERNVDITYGYDAAARLIRQKHPSATGETISREYKYDNNGNITEVNDNGKKDIHRYQPGTDKLLTTTMDNGKVFAYLPTGEVETSPEYSFGYDTVKRLTQEITDKQSGEKMSLEFGSTVQRLRKTVKNGVGEMNYRRYIPGNNGRSMLEQTWSKETGETREYLYIYGPHGLLALETGGRRPLYVLKDHEGSGRFLVEHAAAEPDGVFNYQPFGGRMEEPGGSNPQLLIYRYTGQEVDEEVKMYNYRHRVYDPYRYCFYSPDPAGQYFSPYIYAGDNPILLTDPTGEFNLIGTLAASAEIAGGLLLAPETGGLSLTLVVAGAAGLNYSLRSDNFSISRYSQVEAAAAISTTEIAAGIAIDVASAGTMKGVVGDMLTGAGTNGLIDVFTQINTNPNGNFDWGEWGKQEAIGAVTGLVSGGIGRGISGGIESAAASSGMKMTGGLRIYSGVFSGAFGGAFGGAANTITTNLLYHKKWNENLGQSMLSGMAQGAASGMAENIAGSISQKYLGAPTIKGKILKKSVIAGLHFGKGLAHNMKWIG